MLATLPESADRLFSEDELPEEFGWISWLTPSHQRLFHGELYTALQHGTTLADLSELLDAWQATAELDNDPEARERIECHRHSATRASADERMKQHATN